MVPFKNPFQLVALLALAKRSVVPGMNVFTEGCEIADYLFLVEIFFQLFDLLVECMLLVIQLALQSAMLSFHGEDFVLDVIELFTLGLELVLVVSFETFSTTDFGPRRIFLAPNP